MNKSFFLLVVTLFLTNINADILRETHNYPPTPTTPIESVELAKVIAPSGNEKLLNTFSEYLEQQTASAQLQDKIGVAFVSVIFAAIAAKGSTLLMEWYEKFKVLKARSQKEIQSLA